MRIQLVAYKYRIANLNRLVLNTSCLVFAFEATMRAMSKAQQEKFGMALAIVGVTGLVVLFASANPHCDRGCRTNLQHLFEHVLDDVVEGLLA